MRAELEVLSSALKKRNCLPKNIEISRVGSITMVSAYDTLGSALITESVAMGMDENPNLAVIKALVEWVERLAITHGRHHGLPECMTHRSDGFAAYPVSIYGLEEGQAQEIARQKAYAEALERYAWATWWDRGCKAQHRGGSLLDFKGTEAEISLLKEINSLTPLREIHVL